MRRDVRLLGKILGQVIAESDGQDLLADVEDLRRRVIAARQHDTPDGPDAAAQAETSRPPEAGSPAEAGGTQRRAAAAAAADADIAALVDGWPLSRAEAVARAFTVYFHLANLAEEHQRIRTLRERDTGTEPVRESLAAAMITLAETHRPGSPRGVAGRS